MFTASAPSKYDGCLTICKGLSKCGVVIDMENGLLPGTFLVVRTTIGWEHL